MSDQQPAAATLPNYMKMSGPELAAALGKDPDKWATAFAQQAAIITGGHITHGYIRDWIGKAMEASGGDGSDLNKLAEWDAELTKRENRHVANNKLIDEAEADLAAREGKLAADLKTLDDARADLEGQRTEFEARVKAFNEAQTDKAPTDQSAKKGKDKGTAAVDHPPGNPDSD